MIMWSSDGSGPLIGYQDGASRVAQDRVESTASSNKEGHGGSLVGDDAIDSVLMPTLPWDAKTEVEEGGEKCALIC